jgi:hypothetical protein
LYSCRPDSHWFTDTDTRRHTAECMRERERERERETERKNIVQDSNNYDLSSEPI